jgi:uncharacterized protein
MKKFVTVFVCLLAIVLNSKGQDDNSYEKTLRKLFEVSGSNETYKVAIIQMIDMFKQQYSNLGEDVWDGLEEEFLKSSIDDLVDLLVPVYYKYLTQEDLEGLIGFYESPIGKKYASCTPLITQESMQVGQQWGAKIGQEFSKKIQEKE